MAEINILSAGAVAPGLKKISEAFQRETAQRVHLTFATAPVIVERLRDTASIDIVIAPPAMLDDLARSGKISSLGRVLLGRIGAGVMVRAGVPRPPIHTVEKLKESLLDAASVVRRPTLSLLAAMLPEAAPQDAFDRLRRLPFVGLGIDGLVIHDTIREVVAANLRTADPTRSRAYRVAAV